MNKFFDLLDEYKPKLKFIIALGVILLAFIIGVIIFTINLKYIFYERSIQDKISGYRLGDWYYNSLTYKEQLLYDEIVNTAEKVNNKTNNLPYIFTIEEYNRVLNGAIYDNPQLFYVIPNESQLYTTSRKTHVSLSYYDKKSNIKKMKNELNDKVSEIISEIGKKSEFESDFDIEVAIHDYIIQNCKGTNLNDYIYNTAYGAIINREAYSGGYSAAFKILMNKYGLTCYIIDGEINSQRHFWNMVYINDSYYHVDVAWNDGDIAYADDLLFHAYFNLSSAVIMEDHTISDIFALPAAYNETNYYNVKNLYINDLDELKDKINRIIINSVENGYRHIEMYTNFGADIYDGDEFHDIIINSIKQINQSDIYVELDEALRIYKASATKNILTIQLYDLEK